MTDVPAIVEAAKAKGTFSVLEVAQGRGYPQDIVTVYTDHVSAYEIHLLEKQIADEKDDERVNELDARINELKQKVKASALTFHLRGISPRDIKAIQKAARKEFGEEADFGEAANWQNDRYVAAHIVSVHDAQDNVDEHDWTGEEVEQFRLSVHADTYEPIAKLVTELSFASAYFDATVDADFS